MVRSNRVRFSTFTDVTRPSPRENESFALGDGQLTTRQVPLLHDRRYPAVEPRQLRNLLARHWRREAVLANSRNTRTQDYYDRGGDRAGQTEGGANHSTSFLAANNSEPQSRSCESEWQAERVPRSCSGAGGPLWGVT